MLHTPVALILFNRPDTTDRVFVEIAKAKPQKLFVIADGPRQDHPEDIDRCAAARAVVERVDWECEVFRDYSDINLGCGRRPASGISWVFEQVDRAIILEDDCVPHPTFFRFCDELLERYRDDERIMHIGGNNYQGGCKRGSYSYYFSHHNICHGWATWRRAWKHFDMGVKRWPTVKDTSWLLDKAHEPRAAQYWVGMFDRAYESGGNVDHWDYQWTFACWLQNGLSVLPNTTLINNIGFGPHATHTTWSGDPRGNLPTAAMAFPLEHPPYVVRDREADQVFLDQVVAPHLPKQPTVYHKVRGRLMSSIPPSVRARLRAYRAAAS